MAEAPAFLAVQVCHAASPQRIALIDLQVAPGTTVQQAILRSGLLVQVPDLDLAACRVGIWNKLKTLETVVRDHDRIEVYRPLIADPMEARRRRADKAGKTRG
ncbi:MAG: RnfH family protein [Herminiimonas sp.]|nr:RnfH family protein [Herminiimonas sp.]